MYDTLVTIKQVDITDPVYTIGFTNSFTNCQVHFAGVSGYAGSLLWQWDFGDAVTGTGQLVDHSYSGSGTYPVTLNGIKITNCPVNDTLTVMHQVPIHINQVTVNAGTDTTIFFNLPYQLHAIGTPANASYTWNPATGLNNPFIADPVTALREDITYSVTVTDENGCTATDDKAIKVFGNPEVYVPNSFTPNGDGRNDILKPLGFGLQQLVYFRIYNRYGQLVFQSNDLNTGWDGIYKGKAQPAGTYTYMVKVINYRGWPVEQNGTTIIIR
jgi:gliding motility-associated-like protein